MSLPECTCRPKRQETFTSTQPALTSRLRCLTGVLNYRRTISFTQVCKCLVIKQLSIQVDWNNSRNGRFLKFCLCSLWIRTSFGQGSEKPTNLFVGSSPGHAEGIPELTKDILETYSQRSMDMFLRTEFSEINR